MEKIDSIKYFAKVFLGTNEKIILDELSKISKVISLDKKEILFMEGSDATHIYFVLKGGMKLYRISNDGKEVIIRFVNKNEIFAEAALAAIDKYPVNSSSTNYTELLAISVDKMKKLISNKPEFMMQLLSAMTCQLKYLIDMVSSLTADNTEERLIKYIKRLSENNKSTSFMLPVAKGELALLLGTTPETISRLLTKLKKDGIINVENKRITLL